MFKCFKCAISNILLLHSFVYFNGPGTGIHKRGDFYKEINIIKGFISSDLRLNWISKTQAT